MFDVLGPRLGVDPAVIDALDRASRKAGANVRLTSGRRNTTTTSGHPSRHQTGAAADFVSEPWSPAVMDRIVAQLERDGFTRNVENGNPRAVLWKTMTGGNHFNHGHLSSRGGAQGGTRGAGRPVEPPVVIGRQPAGEGTQGETMGTERFDPQALLDLVQRMTQAPPPRLGETGYERRPALGIPGLAAMPSKYDRMVAARQEARALQPSPYAGQEVGAQADLARAEARSQAYAEPPPERIYTLIQAPPPVERTHLAYPDRPAPQTDGLATAGALIASLISPAHAGQFGAAPLQASQQFADQQYGDSVRRFGVDQERADLSHQDATGSREEMIRLAIRNASGADDATNANRELAFRTRQQGAIAGGDVAAARAEVDGLRPLSMAHRGYVEKSGAAADQEAELDRLAAMNKSELDAYFKRVADKTKLVGPVVSALGAQGRLQVSEKRAATAEKRAKTSEELARERIGLEKQRIAAEAKRASQADSRAAKGDTRAEEHLKLARDREAREQRKATEAVAGGAVTESDVTAATNSYREAVKARVTFARSQKTRKGHPLSMSDLKKIGEYQGLEEIEKSARERLDELKGKLKARQTAGAAIVGDGWSARPK